jgi:hypothetical protein
LREKARRQRAIPREEAPPQVGPDLTPNIGKGLQDLKLAVIIFRLMKLLEVKIQVLLAIFSKIQNRNVLKANKIVTTCIAM